MRMTALAMLAVLAIGTGWTAGHAAVTPPGAAVAISLDVWGDKICGYREYFGSDGKIN